MNGLSDRIFSIEQATDMVINNKGSKQVRKLEGNVSFQDIFNQRVAEKNVYDNQHVHDKNTHDENAHDENVKFSKHANQRLESRNINLSEDQMSRLNQGVSKARDKSINESLVMMDNLAFIVNVKNNTVVTALESNEESNVFTNIDGAVIV